MASYFDDLLGKGLLKTPPKFIKSNVQYEVLMGSIAYGCSNDSSDMDVYGWCLPPKDVVFPHVAGHIQGFDEVDNKFEQYQQHHILDKPAGKEYDMTIYSIIKYFKLCMDNNPNMIDSLFVPQRCVLHCTNIGSMVRGRKDLFLHKGSYHKFKGYAYSQLSKMKAKNPNTGSKRYESIIEHGYDVKFAYHIIRLLEEAKQILDEHTLDLTKSREMLKSVRNGEWSLKKVENYFDTNEKILDEMYSSSKLRKYPDKSAIKQLLLDCLEEHYGKISVVVKVDTGGIVNELKEVLERYENFND